MSHCSYYVIRTDIIQNLRGASSSDQGDENFLRHAVIAKYSDSADNLDACKKYIFNCIVRQTLEHANPIVIGSYHKGQKLPIPIPGCDFDFCIVFGNNRGEIMNIVSVIDENIRVQLFQ